jgi:Transcriptional regulator
MKKQPEITEKTRQAFVNAFCELYTQKPIEKISIQEIANKSGYNRSTFYQYFSDIYELLLYVENDVLNYMKEALKIEKSKSYSTVQNVLFMFEEKGIYLRALLGDYGNVQFLDHLKNEIPLDMLEKNLPKDDPKTPYLIEFHISMSLSLFRLWQHRQRDLSIDQLFDLIDSLYRKGLSSFFPIE